MPGRDALGVDERNTGNVVWAVGHPAFLDFVVVPAGTEEGGGVVRWMSIAGKRRQVMSLLPQGDGKEIEF